MGVVHDENMVEDLTTNRADRWFAVRIHAWSRRCTEQHLHLLRREDSVEGAGVLAVPVAQDEAQRLDTAAQVAGEVAGLLGRPLRGRVRGDAADVQPAAWTGC